ncbi:MAG TPA: DUF1993 domain-containing protein [Ramlibacter sp.]|uniref:DUF1993 domain-containing protein n=1 Tax=Ramlibacter sp. TaxID=1917967 RepID=UPI002D808F45|nr:DUF1993 domain-containing protein [Ramlibacter sp.]HET8745531.1 DUF1993 domain-containing protein [Ramlibacter sp.]
MTMSMYGASIPVFQHMLRNLAHILDKGEASAQARNFDPSALTTYRLAPDMLPFTRQVLIACDAAKLCAARISGVEAPKFEDKEATFPELKERIRKTLDYLETVPAGAMDGTEDKQITFPAGRDRTLTMSAQAYLTTWALPNFFFHVTTAYAILRHNGVDLGKADYLAGAAGR